jgi:hypothetical protein
MSFATFGGLVARHFPLDGEYAFQMRLTAIRTASSTASWPNTRSNSVDRELVKRFTIGGEY